MQTIRQALWTYVGSTRYSRWAQSLSVNKSQHESTGKYTQRKFATTRRHHSTSSQPGWRVDTRIPRVFQDADPCQIAETAYSPANLKIASVWPRGINYLLEKCTSLSDLHLQSYLTSASVWPRRITCTLEKCISLTEGVYLYTWKEQQSEQERVHAYLKGGSYIFTLERTYPLRPLERAHAVMSSKMSFWTASVAQTCTSRNLSDLWCQKSPQGSNLWCQVFHVKSFTSSLSSPKGSNHVFVWSTKAPWGTRRVAKL